MLGWEYNKKMLETYMIDHAEDIGRFWGRMFMQMPTIYVKFMMGLTQGMSATTKKE